MTQTELKLEAPKAEDSKPESTKPPGKVSDRLKGLLGPANCA